MLEKPDIGDEIIIACLQSEYGLTVSQITFLSIGSDLNTAVYRVMNTDETPYFCKLRLGNFNPVTVLLPKFLSDQGVEPIISPLTTRAGQLWAEIGDIRLILYPFIDGKTGFELALLEKQWAAFATALKQIHSARLPAGLEQNIYKERYSSEWRAMCRNNMQRILAEPSDSPVMADFAAFLRSKSDIIFTLLDQSERLSRILASQSTPLTLCHGDVHPGNLLLDREGRLFIVDWDYPMLAPKERDLIFIGGGHGFVGLTAQEEEKLFYRYYDASTVDPVAMGYYRCEQNIIEISVQTTRILSSTIGDQDRAQSLQIINWLFLPDGCIDMAVKALGKLPSTLIST